VNECLSGRERLARVVTGEVDEGLHARSVAHATTSTRIRCLSDGELTIARTATGDRLARQR
jgi:hypothetical protein